jgi:hypothetical protein
MPVMTSKEFYDCEPQSYGRIVELLSTEFPLETRQRVLSAYRRGDLTIMLCHDPETVRLIWFEGSKLVRLDVKPQS